MFEQINNILLQHGYRRVPLNVSGIYFHLQQMEHSGYAIVTIDETSGTFLTREQFLHISEQIRQYLMKQDCYTTNFLYLLITDQTESGRRLFEDNDCYWILSPQSRQFLVYETQNAFFEPLRRSFEQLFPPSAGLRSEAAASRSTSSARPGYTRKYLTCNTLLVAVNVIIFLFTNLMDLFQHYEWLDLGALSWQEVFQHHQYYRLITSMFLHSDLDHIFNNMLVLFFIGKYLEEQVGQMRYAVIYFSTGIIAGFTSMVYNMFQHTNVVSIGASGAIFGLMGALLTIVLLKKGRGQELNFRQLLFMCLFSLYGGLTSEGVDNAAHIGGFLSGILITLILCWKERREEKVNLC